MNVCKGGMYWAVIREIKRCSGIIKVQKFSSLLLFLIYILCVVGKVMLPLNSSINTYGLKLTHKKYLAQQLEVNLLLLSFYSRIVNL